MTITISDIAREAGVSTATVSRMINASGYVKESTRKMINEAINKLNYIPNAAAISLSKQQTSVIGIMVPHISNPFFGEIIKGISHVAGNHNFAVLMCDTDDNLDAELRALITLKQYNVRGLILTPVCDQRLKNEAFYRELEQFSAPLVIIDREVTDFTSDGIFYDNYHNAYQATNFLIQKGHIHIAILAGNQDLRIGRDRLNGYLDALASNGIQVQEKNIVYGNFDETTSYQALKKVLTMDHPPTAIFSSNNAMTKGGLKALIELELEKSIEFFSFDKLDFFDMLNFKVHYYERSPIKLGEMAMDLLIKRIESKTTQKDSVSTEKIYVKPKLI